MDFKKKINFILNQYRSLLFRPKIFCISFQRTGTTSTGRFFKEHGFNVASYRTSINNNWTYEWVRGNYERIFSSLPFKSNQVFDDDPWWCQDFYKVLFYRFPNSKFILLERDADKWFDSMVSHSQGKSLGNTYIHSKIYRREDDFYNLKNTSTPFYNFKMDNSLPLNESYREHYKHIYKLRIREIKEFFKHFGEDRLFYTSLENPNKWLEMGTFFEIEVSKQYDVHANKTGNK